MARARGRTVAVWTLLVLAGLLLVLASFAVWVNRVALNTGVFVDTSSELLEDDAIRIAVAARAVDELFDNVNVRAELEGQLPDNLKSLSGPATAGLRQASYELVERALERQALQRLWALSLRESHRSLVAVLDDDVPIFSTSQSVVTLDLEPIVLETADRIGIRDQVEDNLPADIGRIELFESDELDAAQTGFRLLTTLAWLLPLLSLAAFAAAVWLAPDRRRAVRSIGIVVAVVGLLGLVASNVVGRYLVDSLTVSADVRTAGSNAWTILTELLRVTFRFFVAVGVVFVVAAWIAGPGRRALAVRRAIAPLVSDRVWPYAALGLVALLFLLGSGVSDFTRLLLLVLLLALGAVWIEVLRRQTLREHPDAAGSASVDDLRERVSAWWVRRRAAARATRPIAPMPSAPPGDLTSRLAQLADLHARGDLTDEEYAAAKARVLAAG